MSRKRALAILLGATGTASALLALRCSHAPQRPSQLDPAPAIRPDAAEDGRLEDVGLEDALAAANALDAQPPLEAARADAAVDDPMASHYDTRAELLALIDVRPLTEAEFKVVRPDIFLSLNVGPAVTRMNQGNKAIAHHAVGRQACLAGLKDIVLQTDEQRAICGAPNMVPVYKKGDPKTATYCIDVFEFPNKPCELPFVWAAPTHAATMCSIQGKRLCSEQEWSLACRGDPAGGPDTLYAYGNDLDLEVCNTNKPRGPQNKCWTRDAQKTWETCSTDTEPSGAFPKCRSRFGVFDMHGNVAEEMTRREPDGTLVSQLKGSAFFYAEVARRADEPQKPHSPETYPDHCNYDPRWHIEPMDAAWHVNYHLGFRCCKSVNPPHG
ncbi:MAG TPA: SUMF1/EgtB/PvdO family nonheme iron enzyme [Polyangiaceae bacterium]|nr:SUMF1/EgtB/PvdO family nonheme iron enzyme [Polyangiaceae bacterium]